MIASRLARTDGTAQSDPVASILQEVPLPTGEKSIGFIASRARENFMMWTADSVYECHVNVALPRIFHDLLASRRDGQCLRLLSLMLPRPGLYLAKLFEDAADDAMMEKDYDRALLLYRRSHVNTAKLLRMSYMTLHVVSGYLIM